MGSNPVLIWDITTNYGEAPPTNIPPQRYSSRKCGEEQFGWSCTVVEGHDGPHVAHTSEGVVKCVWEDENTVPYFDPTADPYYKDHEFCRPNVPASIHFDLMQGGIERPINMEVYESSPDENGPSDFIDVYLSIPEARELVMSMIDQIEDAERRQEYNLKNGGA